MHVTSKYTTFSSSEGLFLDNEVYYKYDLEEQRKNLIDELNSYGFSFNYDVLGLDKLRTLYYRKEKYSKNQNE